MPVSNELLRCDAWHRLTSEADRMGRAKFHLRNLVMEEKRLERFSLKGGGIFYDFSRQRVDQFVMRLLWELGACRNLQAKFQAMMRGEIVNPTENRAALHTALRSFSDLPVHVAGQDVMPEIRRVRGEIRQFSQEVHSGRITGSTGKPFRDIVAVGIGGSYLGTQFAASALEARAVKGMRLHYLSNVDIDNFGQVVSEIDPEATLWVIISKTYTTSETTANTRQATEFMRKKGLDPARHFVAVTSKGSPGDDPANPVLQSFHMFDFIGGRYSVSSAVGGVPLSLYLGYECFERFLKGAEEMDIHAATAPVELNIPMNAALLSIWNNNFLKYPAQGIIPYAASLSRLAPHIQQLYMESTGKSVTVSAQPTGCDTGTIVFGEPGTNAQHSFFQLAHQGRPFPIDFIGAISPCHDQFRSLSKGVTNHQELWANLLSQPMALAVGRDSDDPARHFSGNRPSSTLILDDLSPENIGRLLSFYEARTVFEAFVWGINPFDQFGVELGKTLASDIRGEMAEKNRDPEHRFDAAHPIVGAYLDMLFSKKT